MLGGIFKQLIREEGLEAHTDDIILIIQWSVKRIHVAEMFIYLFDSFGSLYFSHDFIGEFTTSYRELSRGQSQFNVYEVRKKNLISHMSFLQNDILFIFWFKKKKKEKDMLWIVTMKTLQSSAFPVSIFRSLTLKRKAGKRNT